MIAGSVAGYTDTDIISQTGSNQTTADPDGSTEWGAINATNKFKNLSSGQPYELTATLGYNSEDRGYSLHVVVVWS